MSQFSDDEFTKEQIYEEQGGEEEIFEEQEEEEEVESYYDPATFISQPILTEDSTIPDYILEFDYSYGYDCRKNYNLVVLDPETILFGSGNYLNFFNVTSGEFWFRRTALGTGIGHIRKNPKYPHFAIAENGDPSLIIIYEWPTLEIYCLLKQESVLYTYLDYSPDGELLVSQSGEPDYNITIWNWPKKTILLRTKSYVNDVFRAKFSPYVPGQLITAGAAHIKFWKMVSTFTGLKLLGEVGRFGKTEFSDILGILGMPDGKVVSGCKWGNILLWDDGLIKLEVFRSLKRTCHDGPIVEFSFADEELWTVGMDGRVRVWWYEKIDQADPPDDDRTIQIEPTYDFDHPGLMIVSIKKRIKDEDVQEAKYYAQDGNGGIWLIDLNTDNEAAPPQQLFRCHAGKIVDLAVCPTADLMATLGEDGRIYIYNYKERKVIYRHEFPAKGGSLIWLPPKTSKYSDELVVGFDDGSLRTVLLLNLEVKKTSVTLNLIQVIKPHIDLITAISVNQDENVLVSGSSDATMFIFQIVITESNTTNLVPIGYVKAPSGITYLTWNCEDNSKVILGCARGQIVQVTVPNEPQDYTTISYLLEIPVNIVRFISYKSQIRRDIKLAEIAKKKAAKVARKMEELQRIQKENPLMQIDEETYLADSDEEEELEPLYYPPMPNPILWIESLDINTVIISVAGFDNAYLYEYKLDQKDEIPKKCYLVEEDLQMNSYIYSQDKFYKIMALGDGSIRVYRYNEEDPYDFTDYWTLSMHDNLNGLISKMAFSADQAYFFSCGHDGNLFSLKFNHKKVRAPNRLQRTSYVEIENLSDQSQYETLSLEQTITKLEEDRINSVANENKQKLREKLRLLAKRFDKLKERNIKLLPTQIIDWNHFQFDPRVTDYVENKLEDNMKLVRRKLQFEVEKSRTWLKKLKKYFIESLDYFPITIKGISKDFDVSTIKTRPLIDDFERLIETVERKMVEDVGRGRHVDRPSTVPRKSLGQKTEKEQQIEYFLMCLSPQTISDHLGARLTRFLFKYRARKIKWEKREETWEGFMAMKPAPNVQSAEDEAILAEAAATIGDFKLRSDPKYKPGKKQKVTKVSKFRDLLEARQNEYETRHNFNRKVFDMRTKRATLKSELINLQQQLETIHLEIDENLRKTGHRHRIKTFYNRSDYPELNMQVNVKLEPGKKSEKPDKQIARLSVDSKEKELLVGKKAINYSDNTFNYNLEELLEMGQEYNDETPWEKELKERRLKRKLFEQDDIIEKMNAKIKAFDEELEDLSRTKQEVQLVGTLDNLLICTLYQELLILKDYETLENALQDKVNNQTEQVYNSRDAIEHLKKDIAEHNEEITKMKQQIREIEELFQTTILDNSFADFLKKVFKKKVHAAKKTGEGDDESDSSSESSESSSSEDEADAASIDSKDFGIVRLDLNVCPKGCEPSLFKFAVDLRQQRFEIQEKISEQLKIIESKSKEKDMETKKMREKQRLLDINIEELEQYQLEKQTKLNEVRTLIVLQLSQIQNFSETGTSLIPVERSLVFSERALMKLYKRVDELNTEIQAEIYQHNQDVRHLTRMNTDIKYMRAKILHLERDIMHMMKKRFGKIINLQQVEDALFRRTFGKDDLAILEELVLKNMVHGLRLTQIDINAMYADEMSLWKQNVITAEQLLSENLNENTSKIELLALLNKEKAVLKQIVEGQDKKKTNLEKVQQHYNAATLELNKLRKVLKRQNQEIELFKEEIRMLKTKGLPPKAFFIDRFKLEEGLREWDSGQEYEGEEAFAGEEEKIQIPSPDAEELAFDIMEELMEKLSIAIDEKSSLRNFIQTVLSEVLIRESYIEIRHMLFEHLSGALDNSDEKTMEMIDSAAEQIFAIQKMEMEKKNSLVEAIVDKIVNDAMKTSSDTFIYTVVEKLVDQLPVDVIKQKSSLEIILNRVEDFDVDEVESLVKETASEDIRSILMDLLNFIKENDEESDE